METGKLATSQGIVLYGKGLSDSFRLAPGSDPEDKAQAPTQPDLQLARQELVLLLSDLSQLFPGFLQLSLLPQHLLLSRDDLRRQREQLTGQCAFHSS
ncbi:hypothetical protein EYF80_032759 [Liparis tanakae]|uniref:Uncharacterized protein n=1 Tax=Liparis tanakae TaxID=230148 RepID=A0A4Z2GTW3_9TELE|nr:hypothetical protein EYF80_032759 [Liparis tanakae]